MYEAEVITNIYDRPGEWFLLVEADNGYRYEETFDLTYTAGPIAQAVPQAGASRAELRRAIASALGDLVQVKATKDGQEATIIDNVGLAQSVSSLQRDAGYLCCRVMAAECRAYRYGDEQRSCFPISEH